MADANQKKSVPGYFLSPHEEAEIVKRSQEAAQELCRKQLEDFVYCVRGRTVSILWKCKKEKLDLSTCINSQFTDELQYKIREEFLYEKLKRIEAQKKSTGNGN